MIRKMLNLANRRRLNYFNMQRQSCNTICNNEVYYDNVNGNYNCKNQNNNLKDELNLNNKEENLFNL